MKRKFLEELGLEQEQIEAVMKEYGSSVESYKATIEEFEENLVKTKEELANKAKSLQEFEEKANLSEEQAKELQELKDTYEQQLQEYDNKVKTTKMNSALNVAIAKSGTVDEVALKAHLSDFLQEAELDEETGSIKGLEDKLNEIKQEKTYLFKKGATGVEHSQAPKPNIEDEVRKAMGLK